VKRVDKKRLVATAVVLIAVVQVGLASVAFYGRRQQDEQLRVARDGLNSLSVQVESAKAQATPAPQPSEVEWSLLENADVTGTLQIVQGLGDAAGITFANVKAAQSSTAGQQSFQIAGSGTPAQICAFVASIEQHARLIVVENGRFLPSTGEQIGFDLGLATYHTGGGQ